VQTVRQTIQPSQRVRENDRSQSRAFAVLEPRTACCKCDFKKERKIFCYFGLDMWLKGLVIKSTRNMQAVA